jgi:hypothetical protein
MEKASGEPPAAREPPGRAEAKVWRMDPARVRAMVFCCCAITRHRCPSGRGSASLQEQEVQPEQQSDRAAHHLRRRCCSICQDSEYAQGVLNAWDWHGKSQPQGKYRASNHWNTHQFWPRSEGTSVSHSGYMSCSEKNFRKPPPRGALPLTASQVSSGAAPAASWGPVSLLAVT